MSPNILTILEKLISFKSITPKESGSIEYITNFLSQIGFKCDIQKFGSKEKEVTNLYAILGDSSPNICFAGHVDVVPPGDRSLWNSDPFTMTIKDDYIYGRGAVDMKGAIACYLSSVAEFLKKHKPKGSISFLITSDEEGEAINGTKAMLEYLNKNPQKYSPKIDLCILGEPTSKNQIGDTIKIGRRGSTNFILKINGKQGHVAYPEKAINPIPTMISILKNLSEVKLDSGSQYFQPSNLEITSIDANNMISNVIPESISARFNIRFNSNYSAVDLNRKIEEIICQYSKNYDLECNNSSTAFIQEYSNKMQEFTKIVQDVCNIKSNIETSGGTSDARFIHLGSEVVELGLNCNLAHKIDEYTKISDLQALHNVYYNCLVKFLL